MAVPRRNPRPGAQSMTISGGSALPKEEIDRMVKDAEAHAEEDRKRREEAETRNGAEQLVYSTEKFLTENADKLPEDGKTEVRGAIDDLKKALEGDDIEAVKSKQEALAAASQKLGSAMYEQAQAAGGEQKTEQHETARAAEIHGARIPAMPGGGS